MNSPSKTARVNLPYNVQSVTAVSSFIPIDTVSHFQHGGTYWFVVALARFQETTL